MVTWRVGDVRYRVEGLEEGAQALLTAAREVDQRTIEVIAACSLALRQWHGPAAVEFHALATEAVRVEAGYAAHLRTAAARLQAFPFGCGVTATPANLEQLLPDPIPGPSVQIDSHLVADAALVLLYDTDWWFQTQRLFDPPLQAWFQNRWYDEDDVAQWSSWWPRSPHGLAPRLDDGGYAARVRAAREDAGRLGADHARDVLDADWIGIRKAVTAPIRPVMLGLDGWRTWKGAAINKHAQQASLTAFRAWLDSNTEAKFVTYQRTRQSAVAQIRRTSMARQQLESYRLYKPSHLKTFFATPPMRPVAAGLPRVTPDGFMTRLGDGALAAIRRVPGGNRAVATGRAAYSATMTAVNSGGASRVGTAARVGGRALGRVALVGGLAVDGVDTVRAIRDGDARTAAFSGSRVVGTGMMMTGFPPAVVAGGVIVGGSLVIENFDAISDAAGRIAEDAGDVARSAGRAVGNAVSSTLQRGGDLVSGAGRVLGGLF